MLGTMRVEGRADALAGRVGLGHSLRKGPSMVAGDGRRGRFLDGRRGIDDSPGFDPAFARVVAVVLLGRREPSLGATISVAVEVRYVHACTW